MSASSNDTLRLRIAVLDPPPDIPWALQLGRDELVPPSARTKTRITFDFSVDAVS